GRDRGAASPGDAASDVERIRPASEPRSRLQQLDGIPALGEIPCRAETREAGSDDDDVRVHLPTVDEEVGGGLQPASLSTSARQSVVGWTTISELPSGSRSQNIGGTGPP